MAEIAANAPLPLKTQAWRFIVTGGLSAIVDFGLYVLLLRLGLQVNVAKSLSFTGARRPQSRRHGQLHHAAGRATGRAARREVPVVVV